MPVTCRIAATALLALAIGGSTAAHDIARTGLGDLTVTRQDVPRVARTGLGDMTTGAPHLVARRTTDRTPGCSSRPPHYWPRPQPSSATAHAGAR
jgi:hypothetical protein